MITHNGFICQSTDKVVSKWEALVVKAFHSPPMNTRPSKEYINLLAVIACAMRYAEVTPQNFRSEFDSLRSFLKEEQTNHLSIFEYLINKDEGENAMRLRNRAKAKDKRNGRHSR
jgi:hypothetical protein